MKAVSPLLVVSLVANVALGGAVTMQILGEPSANHPARHIAADQAQTSPPEDDAARAHVPGGRPSIPDDPAALAAELRAAGVPEHLVRAAVIARINAVFRAREEALRPPRPKLRYWQVDTTVEPLDARLARLALLREKSRLRLELVGRDPMPADAREYPVPVEKQQPLRDILRDYDEVIAAIRSGVSRGIMLPSEQQMLEFVEAEKQREIAALLTPAELADFQMAASDAGMRLQVQTRNTTIAEEEFRQLHALQKPFFDQFITLTSDGLGMSWRSNQPGANQAVEELVTQIKGLLGEERYRRAPLFSDPEIQQLASLAQRARIPPAAIEPLYALRDSVSRESNRIIDQNTPVEQQRAELRALPARAHEQIRTALGPEASPAYLQLAGWWLAHVEEGGAFSISYSGSRHLRTAGPPMPAPSP